MTLRALPHLVMVISALVLGGVNLSDAADTPQELKDACEKGDATACASLGSLYQLGEGIKQDSGQATMFYSKACDGGRMEACFILGVLHAKGITSKQDDTKGEWSTTLAVAEQISHVAAVLVGGVWVYYNFFRGRTYKPRMEPKVSAELKTVENNRFVLVVFEIKNVGLSRIPINQEGTALTFLGLPGEHFRDLRVDVDWQDIDTFSIFADHGWIEPNETVRDQLLIPIRGNNLIALKLELRIVSKGHEWNAISIIEAVAQMRVSPGGEQ